MHLLGYSAVTDVGHQRDNNEDCYLCSPKNGLWIVADGMGGHAAGEVASDIAIKTTLKEIESGKSLEKAIQNAHLAIIDAANKGVGGEGMGSTLVAAKSDGANYQVAWVGDSRAYLWNSQQRSLTQITRDHSYVQMLFETGVIEKHEIGTHPEKNIITQCLGSIELDRVRVSILEETWKKGDLLILCSDGLSDVINNEQICELIANNPTPTSATDNLLSAALKAGGKDNITVVSIAAPNALQLWLYSIVNKLSRLLK